MSEASRKSPETISEDMTSVTSSVELPDGHLHCDSLGGLSLFPCGQGHAPASRSRRPASGKGKTTSVTSGPTSSGSFESVAPASSSASNPYKIDRPGVVSFSGGLTSGYMLWHIIDAYGGRLPDDIKVIFNNTGKERAETLTFVERCAVEWGVDVTWLEYTSTPKNRPLGKSRNGRMESAYEHGFKVVNYATASRNGEPLEAVIKARNMLPNVMARFCTVECKVLTTTRYLRSIGWENWTNAIGLRADEPHRVAKVQANNRHANEEPVCPLHEAKVTKAMVHEWWAKQPFNLGLMEHEGNCDLCFLKGAGKIRRILQDRPDLADWWIRMEAEAVRKGATRIPSVAFFRKDRPRYAVQLELAQRPGLFDDVTEADELSIACH